MPFGVGGLEMGALQKVFYFKVGCSLIANMVCCNAFVTFWTQIRTDLTSVLIRILFV